MTEKPEGKIVRIDFFSYELAKPIHYSEGGSRVAATEIHICAPPETALIKAFDIEQMLSLALMKTTALFTSMRNSQQMEPQALLEENPEGEDKKEDSPRDLGETIRLVARNSNLKMEKAISAFKQVALAGCVKVNGKSINFMQWNEIGQADQMEIFFQFAGVFVLSSLA